MLLKRSVATGVKGEEWTLRGVAAAMRKMAGSVFKGHMLGSIQYLLEEELVVFGVVTYLKTPSGSYRARLLYQVRYCTLKGKTKFNGSSFVLGLKGTMTPCWQMKVLLLWLRSREWNSVKWQTRGGLGFCSRTKSSAPNHIPVCSKAHEALHHHTAHTVATLCPLIILLAVQETSWHYQHALSFTLVRSSWHVLLQFGFGARTTWERSAAFWSKRKICSDR